MERLVVNVEAQVARKIWDEALEVEAQAREMIAAGDKDGGALVMQRAEAIKRAARVTVARAKSLKTGSPPGELEPTKTVPLTDDEIAVREDLAVEAAWGNLRAERNGLLAASDWTQHPDSPADSEAWAAYRQKLRDLPAKTKDPSNVHWPKPPA